MNCTWPYEEQRNDSELYLGMPYKEQRNVNCTWPYEEQRNDSELYLALRRTEE